MISAVSIGLAAYQVVALVSGRPRVSQLSYRFPWGLFIWGWLVLLGAHFISEMLNDAFDPRRDLS